MQIMITAGSLARTRVVQLRRWQIVAALVLLSLALMLGSGAIYHLVLVKAAQAGWPVVSPVLGLLVRDEMAQRDRFMRENLDAIAERVGQIQAKLVQLEAVGERVSGMVGVKPEEAAALRPSSLRPASGPALVPAQGPVPAPGTLPARPGGPASAAAAAGQGGPFVPASLAAAGSAPGLAELDQLLQRLDEDAATQADRFLLIESRLLERRLLSLRVPSTRPVDGPSTSGFGFRSDPFSGRAALHTGLDFPADVGTPIVAAASGVVLTEEFHPAYGRLVEIDHGGGLITRYAHSSRVHVKAGDLVRRGQKIAEVGSSGRSTGPHLHFEVLVDGVPQNPARFLGDGANPAPAFAERPRGLR